MTFTLWVLGIKLDSLTLQARLPKDKFDCITSLLDDWLPKKHCKRKELESFIGHLHHACKVVPQGRTFLCQMINLLAALKGTTIQFVLTEIFTWSSPGGGNSFTPGMVPAASFPLNEHHYLIFSCPRVRQAHLAMGLSLTANGLLAVDCQLKHPCPWRTKSYSQWWWQRHSGVFSGLPSEWNFACTTQ